MTLAQKHQDKAGEYRDRAAGATSLADASVLASVRDMHQRAAAAWTEMAQSEDRAAEDSDLRIAAAARALLAKTTEKSQEDLPMFTNVIDREAPR